MLLGRLFGIGFRGIAIDWVPRTPSSMLKAGVSFSGLPTKINEAVTAPAGQRQRGPLQNG